MEKLYSFLAASLLLFVSINASAQTQTPHYKTVINANCKGFYDYLPAGYNPAASKKYPLIIFLHGSGERGDGSSSQLPRVLKAGLPRLIDKGSFPTSFKVKSQTFSFIVISPQFIKWPSVADVGAVLDYAVAHYKVDKSRIYITGLSMGGGATWEYTGYSVKNASRIAAIVPIAGASWPDKTRAGNIAAGDVAVWATHNDKDPTVPVQYTINYVNNINNARTPPPVPARKTIFTSNSHDAWTKTYDPAFTENGLNMYQWMLQYQQPGSTLPVNLVNYQAFQSGSSQVTIKWESSVEVNNFYFAVERSGDGVNFSKLATVVPNSNKNYQIIDNHPLQGNNFYRLSQTDIDGSVHYFPILRVDLSNNLKNVLRIMPNPATDYLNISLYNKEEGKVTVSLIDMSGRLVNSWSFSKPAYQWTKSISLNNIVSGQYVLEVKGKSFKETQSFLKR